ncbi:glutamic acid-rich protein-like [Homarus americanus]|nr:glutamic acid-rich protein-like [Homarus americanus]
MATYCPEDLASRELCCPICFEDYDIQDTRRTPKLLLCLHTFCFECARKLWKWDGSLECSLCRMLHEQVTLDDLLDNHVIVQHLRREFEERDLEFARRIDQEMRDQDRTLTRSAAEDASRALEDSDVVVITDSDQDLLETTQDPVETTQDPVETTQDPVETTQDPVNASHDRVNTSAGLVGMFHNMVEVGDEEDEEEEGEEEEQEERNFILSNFFGELMEGISQMTEVTEDDNDDYDDVDGDSDEESEVIPVVEDHEEDEESNGYHDEEDENTNPFFSFNNIHSLLGDAYSDEPIHTILNMNDNEDDDADEGEDEEEEDERWHSASDDIINDCWANHEGLPIDDDINEMEDDAPDIFDWHIITSESLMDD